MFLLHRDMYRNMMSISTRLYRDRESFRGREHTVRSMSVRAGGRAWEQSLEIRHVCNPFNHRPARGEETRRILAAAQCLVRRDRGISFFRRSAIASLGEFDNRALRDIGLERSQIQAAVYGYVTLRNRERV
jgi:hypothetical protein